MSMTLGNRGRASSEINVTPMIDVLLVLLIIFMVIFPYHSVGHRTEIPRPSTDHPLPEPSKPIVIHIKQPAGDQHSALKINDEEVSWQDLGSRLEKIYAARADKVAFLKGDPEVAFQTVSDVLDIVHHAGVEHIDLLGT